jgi:hypothetical protein
MHGHRPGLLRSGRAHTRDSTNCASPRARDAARILATQIFSQTTYLFPSPQAVYVIGMVARQLAFGGKLGSCPALGRYR